MNHLIWLFANLTTVLEISRKFSDLIFWNLYFDLSFCVSVKRNRRGWKLKHRKDYLVFFVASLSARCFYNNCGKLPWQSNNEKHSQLLGSKLHADTKWMLCRWQHGINADWHMTLTYLMLRISLAKVAISWIYFISWKTLLK